MAIDLITPATAIASTKERRTRRIGRYTERLAKAEAVSLAEIVIGLYRAELVGRRGPFDVADLPPPLGCRNVAPAECGPAYHQHRAVTEAA